MTFSTPRRVILASGSEIRAQLLRSAGLAVEVVPARIDEEAIREALAAEDSINDGLKPWDWRYYSEKLRQKMYDLDEAALTERVANVLAQEQVVG